MCSRGSRPRRRRGRSVSATSLTILAARCWGVSSAARPGPRWRRRVRSRRGLVVERVASRSGGRHRRCCGDRARAAQWHDSRRGGARRRWGGSVRGDGCNLVAQREQRGVRRPLSKRQRRFSTATTRRNGITREPRSRNSVTARRRSLGVRAARARGRLVPRHGRSRRCTRQASRREVRQLGPGVGFQPGPERPPTMRAPTWRAASGPLVAYGGGR